MHKNVLSVVNSGMENNLNLSITHQPYKGGTAVAHNGNDRVVVDNNSYAGPGKPAKSGQFSKQVDFQSGLPVCDNIVRQINAGSPNGGVQLHTVSPDWGPDPEISPEV